MLSLLLRRVPIAFKVDDGDVGLREEQFGRRAGRGIRLHCGVRRRCWFRVRRREDRVGLDEVGERAFHQPGIADPAVKEAQTGRRVGIILVGAEELVGEEVRHGLRSRRGL